MKKQIVLGKKRGPKGPWKHKDKPFKGVTSLKDWREKMKVSERMINEIKKEQEQFDNSDTITAAEARQWGPVAVQMQQSQAVRKFETGATRSSDHNKNDYEGFLSPLVIKAFGDYMSKHRVQPDGQVRDSDNWQKGITLDSYMKSGWRHFFAMWMLHRGHKVHAEEDGHEVDMVEAICALIFNSQGYLHEILKNHEK